MRINFNRICKLAGIENNSGNVLNEAGNRSYHEDPGLAGEKEIQFGQGYLNEKDHDMDEMDHGMDEMDHGMDETDEGMYEEKEEKDEGMYEEKEEKDEGMYEEKDDELVEVDIGELMSEVRRAKRLINNKREQKRRRQLSEAKRKEDHLKRIIQNEVENILSEIEEKDSNWVYGTKKPRHSKKGYTNQGRTLPGIGFKNNW